MKIGAFCRTGERTLYQDHVGFDDIKAWAVTAESVGFDSFWLPDHLIFRPHEPDQLGCWEVFTFLSALARETSTMTLGSFVAATSFRNPALLAKIAATLDEVSDGRFVLGLGAGNWEPEHTAFGYPFDHRATRFEEAMRIIAPLLREGEVDVQGRYYQANRSILRPQGPSPSGPPIWAGAKGQRMLRIIAEHADGYIAIWPITPEQVAAQWEPVLAACRSVGRDTETLRLTVGTFVHLPEHGKPVDDPKAISGTYKEIAAQLRAFEEAGVDHLVVDFRPEIDTRVIEDFARVFDASI